MLCARDETTGWPARRLIPAIGHQPLTPPLHDLITSCENIELFLKMEGNNVSCIPVVVVTLNTNQNLE